MDNNILVDVIIPVYNVRSFLREALNSVIDQSYSNLEILIIDDGSSDGSSQICDEYAKKDTRISVIHQQNKGLSAARNIGLDKMTGEIVAFLDPDDAFHPEYVETMLNIMIHEKVDVVICKYTVHKTNTIMRQTGREGAIPKASQGKYDRCSSLRMLADDEIGASVWNKIYKRKLWNDIRFPEGRVFEDTNTTYQIIDLCESVFILNRTLYLHRIHSGSITGTYSWDNLNDRLFARSHFNTFIEDNIPEVFSQEQAKARKQGNITVMIEYYAHLSGLATYDDVIKINNLRCMILETKKEVGIETCSLRTKITYYMIRYCPWFLNSIYPLYNWIKSIHR